MNAALQRRRTALFVFFFVPGLILASWVTRTPAIRDAIAASIGQMGLVLAGLSVGSMCGVLLSGHVIQWRGTRFTMLAGLTLVSLSMLTVAAGAVMGWQPMVALGLGLFGLGMGTAEIAVNMDAAVVERESGQHVMHVLHGFFSLGTLVGALAGLAASYLGVSVGWHLSAIFVIGASLLWRFAPGVPPGYGKRADSSAGEAGAAPSQSQRIWRDPRVLMIGGVVFAMALAEGAAYDWLPLLLVDEHGFNAAASALVFVAFAAMMTLGRFTGGYLLTRFGRLRVVQGSILLAAFGVACIAMGHSQALAGLAVVCWGIGVALGFPVALSAAAEGGHGMAERVKAVATIGYVALLVGPPALGFAGQAFGLRGAMLIVLALVAIALILSPSMRTPRTTSS